ncbi:fatty acid desaturase [Salsuginibacillus halophilus]|uniref:Fatty acid desaturase n=1 Tax=Salsuginibacillus halophilus TaxID=517424 RepID=A0A2P8HWP3_9BACI|nr:acyl-CoA desaturase [Salsuginibacillus halophilus]PSL50640.1 fatty acid desaturase [Salsuginibacillus halophilus]
MSELHHFGWYAASIKKHLPQDVFKPVPARLFGGLAYLTIVIGSFLLIGLFDLHLLLNLALSFIIGASFAGMGFLGHEILHGTVVRKPWLRDILGAIAFWPLSTGPKLWRKWHNITHHVHTQHGDDDPDAWPTLEKISKMKGFRLVYRLPLRIRATFSFASLAIQFTAHSLKMFTVYIKEFKPRKQPAVLFQTLAPWITWIGLLFIIGFQNWLFAFLIPLLIGNFIVMAYISTNHRLNPLVPVNDPLANSLSVTVPKWVNVIHFNFSYHTEHHLFPGMSSKYYPLVKEHIKSMWPERYHEMPMAKALKALWQTPRVYFDDNELVDPRKAETYGSLGNGLDPSNIQSRSYKD